MTWIIKILTLLITLSLLYYLFLKPQTLILFCLRTNVFGYVYTSLIEKRKMEQALRIQTNTALTDILRDNINWIGSIIFSISSHSTCQSCICFRCKVKSRFVLLRKKIRFFLEFTIFKWTCPDHTTTINTDWMTLMKCVSFRIA